jgi:hypothetical protein
LLAKSLQDLWGMLNAQQTIIHLAIINVAAPGSTLVVFEFVCWLTQMDVWPTDEIYEAIFNFTESDSFKDSFEILGYENANFMLLIGSTPINMIIVILYAVIALVLIKFGIRYHEIDLIRTVAANFFYNINFVEAIFRVFLEGYMELNICCLICLSRYHS